MIGKHKRGVNAALGNDYTTTKHIVGIFSIHHFLHPTKQTTTTVYFYYCRQTTKRIYKNIIIHKQYIQQWDTQNN